MVSITTLQQKEPGLPNSRSERGNMQDEWEATCSVKKYKGEKNGWEYVEKTQEPLKELPRDKAGTV